MITDRRRIANKLMRIQKFLLRHSHEQGGWEAVYEVDRLRRAAKFDPTWKWEGFESELDWAKSKS